MTNEKKLEELKQFLKKRKIRFCPPYLDKTLLSPDLYLPKYRIMIKESEGAEKDTEFFNKVRYKFHPVFVRDNETSDFVTRKVQNLINEIKKGKRILFHNIKKK